MGAITKSSADSGAAHLPPPSISALIGAPATLPGEDAEHHRASLAALIQELDAKTILQVYIAEKIHGCLWWTHRYEQQKRALVVIEMAALLSTQPDGGVSAQHTQVRDALLAGQVDGVVTDALNKKRHTLDSVRERAQARKAEQLKILDEQIALQVKVLTGLQGAYEQAFHRKLNAERLQIHTELLRRELQTVDVPAMEVPRRAQRQATGRQPR